MAALVSASCSDDDTTTEVAGDATTALTVLAAFYPLEEAARGVGGDLVNVVELTPPGQGPHDLELQPAQIGIFDSADVAIYLGRGFQPQVEAALEGSPDSLMPLDLLDAVELLGVDEQLAGTDGEVDGEVLDDEYREALTNCRSRVIVTSHRAFGYLADTYGLRQIPIAGISPEVEPDPRTLAAIAAEAKAEGVTTVFLESIAPPDLAETVAREIGAELDLLDPIEGLTQDQLDEGATYASIMRDNLERLVASLGCDA